MNNVPLVYLVFNGSGEVVAVFRTMEKALLYKAKRIYEDSRVDYFVDPFVIRDS